MFEVAQDNNALKLYEFLRGEEKRKAAIQAELIEAIQSIPVPDEVLSAISFEHRSVLEHHPGYQADRILLALWSVLESLNQCHSDLVARMNEFAVFSTAPGFSLRRGAKTVDEIHVRVRKELLAFSSAAAALVEHARRVESCISLGDPSSHRKRYFDLLEHRFVIELRNLISHGHFPMTKWQIDYMPQRRTDFILDSRQLLALGTLNRDAAEYIRRAGKHIGMSEVVDSYMRRVREYYAWYRKEIEANLPPSVADYRRCNRVHLANSARVQYRFFLAEWIKRGADPYQYLERYLSPEEMDAMRKYAHRSREQVDYIISVADEYRACDDELRGLIYRLFGVTE